MIIKLLSKFPLVEVFCLLVAFSPFQKPFLDAEEIFQHDDFSILFDPLKREQMDDKKIKVRGFLYRNEQEWLLSHEPQVKSCCVGKLKFPLILKGEFDPHLINQVVDVEGILKYEDNQVTLHNPLVAEKKRTYAWVSIGGLILLITLWGIKKIT